MPTEEGKITVHLDKPRTIRFGLGTVAAICRDTNLGFKEIQDRLNAQRFDTMFDVARAIIHEADPSSRDVPDNELFPPEKFQGAFSLMIPELSKVAQQLSGQEGEPEEDVEAPGKGSDGTTPTSSGLDAGSTSD